MRVSVRILALLFSKAEVKFKFSSEATAGIRINVLIRPIILYLYYLDIRYNLKNSMFKVHIFDVLYKVVIHISL